jgi:hypothetical protein
MRIVGVDSGIRRVGKVTGRRRPGGWINPAKGVVVITVAMLGSKSSSKIWPLTCRQTNRMVSWSYAIESIWPKKR